MRRKAVTDLVNWKYDEARKPMVLKGARQEIGRASCRERV